MKIKTIILALSCCLLAACGTSNERYVKKAVRTMDKEGLFAVGDEWQAARQQALAASPATLDEAHSLVEQALRVAGGKHSFLKVAADVVTDDTATSWPMPSIEFLNGTVAIITLPPFGGNADEGRRYARTVLDALPDQLDGVVIDLRDNTGGNMYPMIAALHRFLPDDVLLTFRSRKGAQPINAAYVLSTAGLDQQAAIRCPVALLTNERTASSGEATLLCFRGLEQVRVFGAPTAGYASANTTYTLPDGAQMMLTTGCDVARTREEFCDDPIAPDTVTATPRDDALQWLSQQ